VILEAPPGAGKSTIVPLFLLQQAWREDQRILVLEPRRVAARAVARRMAMLRGEAAGEVVGYRTRLETRVSPRTRIEVVTEGILTRMLQRDPALEGIACVVFDEFHERSLQADLGLALCLDTQAHLRESLRLLLMSATIDGAAIAEALGDVPVVSAPGKMHEVQTVYCPAAAVSASPAGGDPAARAAAVAQRAIAEHAGDVLVFLPGAGEIRRAVNLLENSLPADRFRVRPLFGELPPAAQDAALQADRDGLRKIVVATNLAETSLTIEGVRIVVDAGLEKRPRFDPNSGMSRLETRRIAASSADQRRGRAGRTAPGACYRLWGETEQRALSPQSPAEILEADLAPLALELACWGCTDATALTWLDPPPRAHLDQARDLLRRLGAVDDAGRATAAGRRMAALGLHPRLAHMVLESVPAGMSTTACHLAALLGERDPLNAPPGRRDPDLRHRLEVLAGGSAPPGHEPSEPALRRIRQVAKQIERLLGEAAPDRGGRERGIQADQTGALLALAYPDRIGRARGTERGAYLLSGGRGARFAGATALARSEYIVAAELEGMEREALIRLAAPVSAAELEQLFAGSIRTVEEIRWDARSGAVVARRQRRLGELVLSDDGLAAPDAAAVTVAMLDGVRALGLDALNWSRAALQLRARMAFARAHDAREPGRWPDVSDAALLGSLEDWLAPWLGGITRREHLARLDMHEVLRGMLDWQSQKRLDEFAPARTLVPSGSQVVIDYAGGTPTLSVRLQEVFGLKDSPRVADGRVAVTLELLSPARRPVQLTQDLASFWTRGYPEVRKELKGRYPKHYWPEDPWSATATRRVRPAGEGTKDG
jgi:ATP-dependent helicase HrpB